jgi:hypothetical protein
MTFTDVEKEVAKHSPTLFGKQIYSEEVGLFYIIERLKRIPTLRKYLEPKLKNEEWSYGEGFIVGSRSKEGKHLVNKDTLPTKAFTLKGIDNNKIEKLKEEFFDSPCKDNQNIFKAPHILIKEDIEEYEDIPITFYEKDISFKHSVIGIHSPNNKKDELLGLYKILLKNRDLYKFYIFSTSNRILVGKATSLLKQDIDNLPHPENPDDLKLAHWEEIFKEDVLNYYLKFKSEGEKSAIMKIASRKQLNEYSKVFADTLNSVYEKKDKKYRSLNHLETATFVCLSFYYGTEKQHKEQEKVELKEESLQKIVFEKNK